MSDAPLRDPNFENVPTRDTEEISINQVDPREQARAQLDELHRQIAEEKTMTAQTDLAKENESLKEELAFYSTNAEREKYHRRLEILRLVWGAGNTNMGYIAAEELRARAARAVDAAQILLDFAERAEPQPMLLRSSDGTPIQIGPATTVTAAEK